MKPLELLPTLKRNGLASLYLILGEEDYLRDEVINTIRSWKKTSETGIGEKIYQFAQKQPIYYGILSILFAVISGLTAAGAFRRL